MRRAMTFLALSGCAIAWTSGCGDEGTGEGNQTATEGTMPPPGPSVMQPGPGDTSMMEGPPPTGVNPPGTTMPPSEPGTVPPSTTPPSTTPMEPEGMMPMEPEGMMPMEPEGMMPMEPEGMMPAEPEGMMPVEPEGMMPVEPVDPGPVEGAYEPCSGEAPPALQLTEVFSGLDSPISMVTPEADATTFFVAERSGSLLRFSGGSDTPTTLTSVETSVSAECGFLSVALHPNFDGTSENRIYLSYNPTCPTQIFGAGGSSALEEYIVEGDTATLSRSLFSVDQPEGNHNGGSLVFGPDGYLYFGLGDGGGSNDQHGSNGNGQDVAEPLGSILRFDVDAPDTPPAGNLTSDDVGGASVDGRIFHYGVRNPWRFSFDRDTGDLYIGDVGQDTREEVSFVAAGAGPTNFGWSAREGTGACSACGNTLLAGTTAVEPIYDYATPGGGSGFFQASVTGGYVYRGRTIPGMIGRYVFGDYVRGDIQALTYDGQGGVCDVVEELIPGASIPAESLSSFAEDADGELYVLNMARGSILKMEGQ